MSIPANTFSPGDDSGLQDLQIIAARICKMHKVELSRDPFVEGWETSTVSNSFLHEERE